VKSFFLKDFGPGGQLEFNCIAENWKLVVDQVYPTSEQNIHRHTIDVWQGAFQEITCHKSRKVYYVFIVE